MAVLLYLRLIVEHAYRILFNLTNSICSPDGAIELHYSKACRWVRVHDMFSKKTYLYRRCSCREPYN